MRPDFIENNMRTGFFFFRLLFRIIFSTLDSIEDISIILMERSVYR